MKVRILTTINAAPDGIEVQTFEAGAIEELPDKLARTFIAQSAALPIDAEAAPPDGDGEGFAEGVTPPAADSEVNALHRKHRELLEERDERKANLENAVSERKRMAEQAEHAGALALVGDDPGEHVTEEELTAARRREAEARRLLREASAALEIIGEKLVERVEAVEEDNVQAANEMNAALHTRAVEAASAAVEALEAHRAFAAKHRPWLDNNCTPFPTDKIDALQTWIENG